MDIKKKYQLFQEIRLVVFECLNKLETIMEEHGIPPTPEPLRATYGYLLEILNYIDKMTS